MWNQLKTTILLASLAGILMLIGSLIGGYNGIVVAFIISIFFNAFAYFFSDKMVLRLYNAKPLDRAQYDWIYSLVEDLAQKSNIPMPKLWLVKTPMANAFATGRNPKHASVAVTTGILDILNPEELRGVLAHELSHVINRDILVSSVAATMASAIGYVANMMQNMAFWSSQSSNERENRPNPLALLFMAILMPIAASLIQLAISRSREYLADESGAHLCHDPLALASALEKLQSNIQYAHLRDNDTARATTAHMFIVNPFTGQSISALFSTHPPMKQRVERLRKINEEMLSARSR